MIESFIGGENMHKSPANKFHQVNMNQNMKQGDLAIALPSVSNVSTKSV